MPRLINAYIFKELAVPFFLAVAILTLAALLGRTIKIVELVLNHGVGIGFVFWFILSLLPPFLVYTLPLSFLAAILITFARLSYDNEITAMKAAGISLYSLMRPVLALALLVYAITLFISLYLYPWGNINAKRLLFDVARTKTLSAIEEKTFYDNFKGVVMYVDRIPPGMDAVEGVFILERAETGGTSIIFAEKGMFIESAKELSVTLRLFNGALHRKGGQKDKDYHILGFKTYQITLDLEGGVVKDVLSRSNKELYLTELIRKIASSRSMGENTTGYVLDLNKRFALPAAVFVFALLGVPMGLQRVRSARLVGFTMALFVALVYYTLSKTLEALGKAGTLNPVVSVWAVDIVMAGAGFYMLSRAAKDAPIVMIARFEKAMSKIFDRLNTFFTSSG
ncbi:MAG: LPS export ABC transporter permease LptF [Deltaproteobacteria bacterium]|nr:LPS export ABC transporter permease LptF [Deltaproteobacteria bacterium]